MNDEMTVAASVALLIRKELDEDYVELWKLPWHIRRALPDASDAQVQRIATSILESLTGTGVILGELDEFDVFVPWPATGAIERAMSAWRDLGRDPNIGDGAWLAAEESMTALRPGGHLTPQMLELVAHVARPLGAEAAALSRQARSATVRSCSATMVDLDVPETTPELRLGDGPVPTRAIVYEDNLPSGEILVWVRSGRLIGLEQAWYTDAPPTTWPSPETVKVT